MGKLVIINFVEGNFENGFSVYLEIRTEGDNQLIADAKGKLSPNINLYTYYINWQLSYRNYISGRNGTRISVTGGSASSILNEIKKASKQLNTSLNSWLKADVNFSPIREKLFQSLKDESEEIRVIFKTENPELQRLPWHLWDDFFSHYHRAEVVLSLPVKQGQIVSSSNNKVKILAVFGKDTRINTLKDWEMLEKLLTEDANATLIPLDKPDLDHLCEQIEKHQPQILFFAGHSRSEDDNESGFIDLNDEETITISDLEPELKKAVRWGLQLAIFNSCDGLGIARELGKSHLPNIIVMREPVPDEVAQKFLQRFLEAFAAGKTLHLAVRRARERINRLESKFPGATWLPMTFQNPAKAPLTWRSLGGIVTQKQSNQTNISGESSEIDPQSSILWLPTAVNPPIESSIQSEVSALKTNCLQCGANYLPDAVFCRECGINLSYKSPELTSIQENESLIYVCPNCNHPNPNSSVQCEACYTPLSLPEIKQGIEVAAISNPIQLGEPDSRVIKNTANSRLISFVSAILTLLISGWIATTLQLTGFNLNFILKPQKPSPTPTLYKNYNKS